jgi:hypothetical protein
VDREQQRQKSEKREKRIQRAANEIAELPPDRLIRRDRSGKIPRVDEQVGSEGKCCRQKDQSEDIPS